MSRSYSFCSLSSVSNMGQACEDTRLSDFTELDRLGDGYGDGLPDDPTQRMAVLYSRLAQAYARLWSPVIRPMALPLLRALPLNDARHILDVGTGVGALIPDIRAASPKADIVGVDQAEGMLRLAHENGSRFNVS